jgi:hypothetical protein
MKTTSKHQLTTLIATSLLFLGCVGNETSAPKPHNTTAQATQEPTPTTGVKLSNLKNAGSMTSLSFKGKKAYSENESIQFMVDTGDQEGYLYIIYLDNQGKTTLLYPNPKAPLTEMGGSFLFPNDFGNVTIRATKDCKSCSQEKTTIYALLSKTPILDIDNIDKSTLLGLTSPKNKDRGVSLELNDKKKNNSQLHIGKVDFLVQ